MRTVIAALLGAIVGAVHLLLTGFLAIQISGKQSGAVYDLSNSVVQIQTPGTPVAPLISLAILGGGALQIMLVLAGRWSRPTSAALRAGYVLTTVTLSVVASMVVSYPQEGFAPGLEGWLVQGGVHPVVHLSMVIVTYSLIRSLLPDRVGAPRRRVSADDRTLDSAHPSPPGWSSSAPPPQDPRRRSAS